MKNLLLVLTVVIVVALVIAGLVFFGTATSQNGFIPQSARTMSLICGIICLVLATALLTVAVIASRGRDERPHYSPSSRGRPEPSDSIALPDKLADSGDGIRPI